jgi:uncharacterized membrane protein
MSFKEENMGLWHPALPSPPELDEKSPPRRVACLSNTRLFIDVALTGILLAGIALRGYRLPARSLWFDEAFSWRLSQFPYAEVVARTARDNHPPLYFLLLKAWSQAFGTSELALRSLSVLFGSLTILGMYLFTVEAFGGNRQGGSDSQRHLRARQLGLLVAALVALSAFQIRWSWEVRMYALGTALAAFSSWALFRCLRPMAKRRDSVLYGVLLLLFAYTHYYALFSLAAQAVFLAGFLLVRARGKLPALLREPAFHNALVAAAIVILGLLPWLPSFLAQRDQVKAHFWTPTVDRWVLQDASYQMLLDPEGPKPYYRHAEYALALSGAVLLALLWKARSGEWYLFCAALGPVALGVAVSWMDTNSFNLRYLLFANLSFLAAIAVLVMRISAPRIRTGAIVLLVTCLSIIHVVFWNKLDVVNKPGARGAVAAIAAKRKAGEPVVVSSPLLYFSLLYHCGDETGWRLYNERAELLHYQGTAVAKPGELISSQELAATRSDRVWVVEMAGGYWGDFQVPVPADWVEMNREEFPEVYWLQGNLYVAEYRIPRGS